jgi:predicted nucleic acid-binding protein
MITAIDTNVLLDLLIPDQPHSLRSKQWLEKSLEKGQLLVAGKYLKQHMTLHEETGTLDVSKDRIIESCKRCFFLRCVRNGER